MTILIQELLEMFPFFKKKWQLLTCEWCLKYRYERVFSFIKALNFLTCFNFAFKSFAFHI